MTAEVKLFNGVTRLDMPADLLLAQAAKAGLKGVVIVGENADGTEYFSSSMADGANALWALERAKLKLLQIVGD